MLCYLDVLAADRGRPVAITHPDSTISVVAGLGDPQAARVWLLQALTGRRAAEILMLDFNPLAPIPGQERPTDSDDPDAFVAKLRYQQTKVDGVLPIILVEQAVVNVIAEQQGWISRHYPNLSPKYLFLGLRHQHQGQRPRTYQSYGVALGKLDKFHGLTDAAGNPLRFSQTHRLRHSRATELLNDGVPIHVVQRYLGHASPEMTLRYASTLAATAEAESLRHKKIGAHGADITISPSDIYDMTQLSQRTDRLLPGSRGVPGMRRESVSPGDPEELLPTPTPGNLWLLGPDPRSRTHDRRTRLPNRAPGKNDRAHRPRRGGKLLPHHLRDRQERHGCTHDEHVRRGLRGCHGSPVGRGSHRCSRPRRAWPHGSRTQRLLPAHAQHLPDFQLHARCETHR